MSNCFLYLEAAEGTGTLGVFRWLQRSNQPEGKAVLILQADDSYWSGTFFG